jgi:hypothetical protein
LTANPGVRQSAAFPVVGSERIVHATFRRIKTKPGKAAEVGRLIGSVLVSHSAGKTSD